MIISKILKLFPDAKQSGDGWTARCPAHDDHNPSLSIKEGTDGRTLLHCHAGCTPEAICAELKITPADLFVLKSDESKGRIVATYPYHDAKDKLLFEVVRYEPKDFRQRKPDSTVLDGWTWSTKGVEKVLFRLPETLHDIRSGKFIFLCEGEKDVLTMSKYGLSATCNPGGAGKWLDSYTEILRGAKIVILPDKDTPGRAHAALVAAKLHGVAKSVRVIELPDVDGKVIKDAFDFFTAGGVQIGELVDNTPEWTPPSATDLLDTKPVKPMIEFFTPSQLSAFTPPEGFKLVGDYHIQKATPFVIGGAPGIGKSRGAVGLAVAGATGADWFGHKVHRPFRTMILQAENGRVRLKNEFADLDCPSLDDFLRVCSPPPCGFAFDRPAFREQLRREIDKFQPDVFILDPFNRLAQDDKAKDYASAFEDVLATLPIGDDAPALGIVAHTRKPRTEERASGRSLLNTLAGSYVIGSIPRTVFVMQAASDDTADKRIVWTCCKNNDGELGTPSAWERRNGLFSPVQDFDWKAFDGEGEKRRTVSLDDLDALFEGGKRQLARSAAVEKLMEQTELKHTACYQALKAGGKFSQHLVEQNGLLNFKA